MVDGGHYPVGGASEIAYNMIPVIGNIYHISTSVEVAIVVRDIETENFGFLMANNIAYVQ